MATTLTIILDIAPEGARGRYTSFAQMGSLIGTTAGSFGWGLLLNYFNYSQIFFIGAISTLLPTALIWFLLKQDIAPAHKRQMADETDSERGLKDILLNRDVLIVFFAGLMISFVRSALHWGPDFQLYLRDFLKLDLSVISTLLGVNCLAYIAMLFFSGTLSDTFGRKIILILGFFLYGVGIFLITSFSSIGTLGVLVDVLIFGVSTALIDPTLSAFIGDRVPGELRGHSVGIFRMFSTGGMILGPIIWGWVLDGYGFATTFFLGSIFLFVAAFTLCFVGQGVRKGSKK